MAIKVIVVLFDKAAGQFMQPFFVPAIGAAYRSLQDEAARGGDGNMLASHPGDFQVFQLGAYEDTDGSITYDKQFLCEVQSLVVPKGE